MINIDCLIIPQDPRRDERITPEHTVVVIDILRVSSTIVTAMESGAERIYPVMTISEALSRKDELIREGRNPGSILLGGERGGVRIEGFDLGNSPLEYSRKTVLGKTLILSSTNGTRVMKSCTNAGRVLVGSFLNRESVASAVIKHKKDLTIYLSGKEGSFSFEDAAGAGAIIEAVERKYSEGVYCTDAARMCKELFRLYESSLPELLAGVSHGQYLISLGYEKDIDYCASFDISGIVPVLSPQGYLLKEKP